MKLLALIMTTNGSWQPTIGTLYPPKMAKFWNYVWKRVFNAIVTGRSNLLCLAFSQEFSHTLFFSSLFETPPIPRLLYSRTSLIRNPKLRAPPSTGQLLCTLWLGKVSQLANLTAAFGWTVQLAALFWMQFWDMGKSEIRAALETKLPG